MKTWKFLMWPVVLSLIITLGASPAIAARGGSSPPVLFSGQATAVQATVLGITTVISEARPLPSSGGAAEASLLQASVPGLLTAEVLHAATIGQGDRSRSEASVANLNLTVGGNTLGAGFLMSRAMAVCTSQGPQVSGSSEIAWSSMASRSSSAARPTRPSFCRMDK